MPLLGLAEWTAGAEFAELNIENLSFTFDLDHAGFNLILANIQTPCVERLLTLFTVNHRRPELV